MDTASLESLAQACNTDRRFIDANWTESAEGVATLMSSGMFQVVRRRLVAHGVEPTMLTNVATVFACRLTERRRSSGGGALAVAVLPALEGESPPP